MNNSETHYKEIPLFKDINDSGHRAWNRLNIVNNLRSAGRDREAAAYLDKLSELDRVSIAILLTAIKKKGVDKVRAELNRGLGA